MSTASTLTRDSFKNIRISDSVADGVANIAPADGTLSVVEKGSGETYHVTQINIADMSLITPAAAADLASGKLIYTLPGGRITIDKVYLNLSVDTGGSTVSADTPDLGLGTTVASGAVATLDGTAAFEDVLTGQTMGDVDGTAKVATAASTLTLEDDDDKTIYLNIADGWVGAEATGVQATGTVILVWKAL